jgi:hypothetical protein
MQQSDTKRANEEQFEQIPNGHHLYRVSLSHERQLCVASLMLKAHLHYHRIRSHHFLESLTDS